MARLFQVDSFTDKEFAGNPAGVCLLEGPAEESWMRSIAAEMNLAETAFVYPKGSDFQIRWFSPTIEVPLCGHATLASAHILWEIQLVPHSRSITFHSMSGPLSATRSGDLIELDFPRAEILPQGVSQELLKALNLKSPALSFGKKSDSDMIFVEIASEKEVAELIPDLNALKSFPWRATIVTAPAEKGKAYDFVSRFFAPKMGIDEDPVTGAAHCALGPFWGKKLNRSEVCGFQASKRGGMVKVSVGDTRVKLKGPAITIFEAQLKIPSPK